MKGKVNVNPGKIEILALPKLMNFFPLRKKFKIIPSLHENRDKVFLKMAKKIRVEKYWTPIFPGNFPNAKNFSEKIICKIV